MRMKRMILTGCMLLLSAFLTGCNAGNNVPDEKADNSKEQMEAAGGSSQDKQGITPTPRQQQNEKPEGTQSNNTDSAAKPESMQPPVSCDRLDDWDAFYQQYGCYYSAVQIEDMFFYPGMMGSELGEAVAASADKEIEAVAMTKLVEADEGEKLQRGTQKFTYYRGEEAWFDVYVRNASGDLQALKDCIVSLVLPCEAALDYCRFFDGTYTLASLKNVSYTEYETLAERLGGFGYVMSKAGNTWSVKSKDAFSPASLEETIYWAKQLMTMELEINLDTGLVENVQLSAETESNCAVYGRQIPEDFDWSDKEFAESLFTIFSSAIQELKEPELVSLYRGNSVGHYIAVFRDKEALENGTYSYKICERVNVGIDLMNHATHLSEPVDAERWAYLGYDETWYIMAEKDVYQICQNAELIHVYQENVDHYVSEDYDWGKEICRESLKGFYEWLESDSWYIDAVENEEVVAIFKENDSSDFRLILRCTNPGEADAYFYREVEIGRIVEDAQGRLWMNKWIYSPSLIYSNDTNTNTYDLAVAELTSRVPDVSLVHAYEEFKPINSFADMTTEQINQVLEFALAKTESKYTKSKYKQYITGMSPVYISFGNAEIEGEHLQENALWMVTTVNFCIEETNEAWTEYVYVDVYGLQVNLALNCIEFNGVSEMDPYEDGYQLFVDTELFGTPEENRWVSELLPYETAMELVTTYGYGIYQISVDMEGHE